MERVLILSAGVGSGHNSAAAAVKAACEARGDVEAVETLDVLQVSTALYRDVLGKGYFVLADGVPWLVEWGYDISDPPFRRRGPVDPWTRANALPAVREIRRFAPTSIISTHFLPAKLISSMLLRGSLDARTAVVTTDYDFQGLWLSGAFHSLSVARAEGREQLTQLGVPADRVQATGIPIVAHPADAETAEEETDARPMLLVSAGAAGGDYASAVVRQLLHCTSDFRATVVCGKNAALKATIERITAPARDRITVLGYTTEMPRLLREAALFIGKPGGLSASECMAAGLPMVLVNPIPGQEVRNGDYLIEQGAAVRCNMVQTIAWKVDGILADPERLERMTEAATRIGRPDAAADVVASLLDGSRRPLVITRAAQRTILAASERHLVATDLTGPTALARLVDDETGCAVALLRADQLLDLHAHFGGSEDEFVLTRFDALSVRWEAKRLIACILGTDDALRVRIEHIDADDRQAVRAG